MVDYTGDVRIQYCFIFNTARFADATGSFGSRPAFLHD